jgi:heterodisulfide reductase subunit A2
VCCTSAVKNSLKLKELNPQVQVSVLYRDIRTFAFKEISYQEARRQGVRFFGYDLDQKPRVKANGDRIKIDLFDQQLGRPISLESDLLVLSAAIRPREESKKLAETLRLPLAVPSQLTADPPHVHGRMNHAFLLNAYKAGADGVMVSG